MTSVGTHIDATHIGYLTVGVGIVVVALFSGCATQTDTPGRETNPEACSELKNLAASEADAMRPAVGDLADANSVRFGVLLETLDEISATVQDTDTARIVELNDRLRLWIESHTTRGEAPAPGVPYDVEVDALRLEETLVSAEQACAEPSDEAPSSFEPRSGGSSQGRIPAGRPIARSESFRHGDTSRHLA